MAGGNIGGVAMSGIAAFTMTGGTISNNTAEINGNGVFVPSTNYRQAKTPPNR